MKKVGSILGLGCMLLFSLFSLSLVSSQAVATPPIPAVYTCPDNQTILRLSAPENAHAANASTLVFPVKICYNNPIFNFGYYPYANGTACTGANAVLRLSKPVNAHAQSPTLTDAAYAPICFGDLLCDAKTACAANEAAIASLSTLSNAHLSNSSLFYTYKLCCKKNGSVPPIVTTSCGDGTVTSPNSAGFNEQCDPASALGNASCAAGTNCTSSCTCVANVPQVPGPDYWVCGATKTRATKFNSSNSPIAGFIDLPTLQSSKNINAGAACKGSNFNNGLACCPTGYICSASGCIINDSRKTDQGCANLVKAECNGQEGLAWDAALQVNPDPQTQCLHNAFGGSDCTSTCYCAWVDNACSQVWNTTAPDIDVRSTCTKNIGSCGNDACTTKNLGLSNCINDQQTISLEKVLSPGNPRCDPKIAPLFYINESSCKGAYTQTIPCGRALMSLPFFSALSFGLSLAAIALIYAASFRKSYR